MLVSFTDSGGIKVRIPLKMWGKSISTGRLVQEFRGGLNRLTMANFLKLLNEHVEAYLRTSFQYPLSKNQVVTHFSLPQGRKNRTITELFLSIAKNSSSRRDIANRINSGLNAHRATGGRTIQREMTINMAYQ